MSTTALCCSLLMSCQGPELPVRMDSDDEWLQELLTTPAPPPVVVGTDSDDEFLRELLTPPPTSTMDTLSVQRPASSTEPERPVSSTGQHSVQCPAQATERRSQIPCVGCPEEMLDRHGELLAGIGLNGQIRDGGIMVFFRRDTFEATQAWVQGLSVPLCERMHGLLPQEVCIFNLYYRMYNKEFGYTQRSEIYDRMDLRSCVSSACVVVRVVATLLQAGNGRPIPRR